MQYLVCSGPKGTAKTKARSAFRKEFDFWEEKSFNYCNCFPGIQSKSKECFGISSGSVYLVEQIQTMGTSM